VLFFCYFSPYTAHNLFTPTSTLYICPIIHCAQFFLHTFCIWWNMKYTCSAIKCNIQPMHCCESCLHVYLICLLQSISLSKYSQSNYCLPSIVHVHWIYQILELFSLMFYEAYGPTWLSNTPFDLWFVICDQSIRL